MTERAKWGLLAALGVSWLAVIFLRVMTAPEPQQVPLTFVSGRPAAQTRDPEGTETSLVIKPITVQARKLSHTPKKNIFAPLDTPTSHEPGSRPKARKPAVSTVVKVEPTPSGPPPPSPEEVAAEEARRQHELKLKQVREQMAQYRYLGYLTRDGERQAFLTKGREIYIIRLGETLEGKFLVASIESTEVKLREAATNLEATLSLTKNTENPL